MKYDKDIDVEKKTRKMFVLNVTVICYFIIIQPMLFQYETHILHHRKINLNI